MKSNSWVCALAGTVLVVLVAVAGMSRVAIAQGTAGEVRWFGLLTSDASAASGFYEQLFGWQVQRTAPGRYLLSHNGELIAGITEIESEEEATWITGVVVSDLEASLAATAAQSIGLTCYQGLISL